MQSTITIPDIQISFLEFRQIQQHMLLRQRWWIYVLLLGYLLYTAWFADTASTSVPFKIGLTAFFIALLVGMLVFANRVLLKRSFNKIPLHQQPVTYTLSETGIALHSRALQSTSAWHTVHSARKVGDWYFLANKNQQGYLLDSRRIQAPATEADLRALFQQHGIVIQ
ncbi:hypothetical protein [Hymenobacter perfusus]|uniref:YcxB family protein n=1 Tax=Hymenobacter perfusus TaxID=1236770 RepID=A0A428K7U7_9BACT|nr:hypothetical protein [Hymenobacter perfusus]RSK42419.1 hypothetical protein EI293_16010 [Hymenobacter perfusus]